MPNDRNQQDKNDPKRQQGGGQQGGDQTGRDKPSTKPQEGSQSNQTGGRDSNR